MPAMLVQRQQKTSQDVLKAAGFSCDDELEIAASSGEIAIRRANIRLVVEFTKAEADALASDEMATKASKSALAKVRKLTEESKEQNMQINPVLSNPEQYSQLWKKESEHLESHGIYELLSKITPMGNILEFGCGIGKGTHHLSINRNILSLDSNETLINEANRYLDSIGASRTIYKCDFFELTADDKKIIKEFLPAVIVGWFIGSHGEDIFKHAQEEPNAITKSKLYREKIEDIIVSPDVCLASVEYIHLVNRGGRVVGFTEAQCFNETKKDYDSYVFRSIGFEVVEVKNIDWPREGSEFIYGQAHNPNLAKGETVPTITSILAKRIK